MILRRYSYVFLLLLFSCKQYHPASVQWTAYHFEQKKQPVEADTAIRSLIAPYKAALDSQMNVVIGTNSRALTSGKPEGSLGNFFADAIREQAEKAYNKKIDVAFFNSGGLRIQGMPAGAIKVTTIYELMPFDNEIVLMQLDGATLMQILEYSARRGGDPISGVRYVIGNNKPENITINGEAIDLNKAYAFATNDYLADGGDNMNFLKTLPREKINLKLRDMLFDYFKTHTQPLNVSTDGRVQLQK
jgi:2',3'-cyclic-nucleotide 2'-phosphodiesterase (5'-nucleotidase family)